MANPALKRLGYALTLPMLVIALIGCSGQPRAAENQQAKEADAKEKLKNNFMNDPTLQPPGAAKPPVGGLSPGPVPGGGGAMPNPGPVPGGGR